MRDELIAVVEAYLDGLRKKDLSQAAFAPDVTFESPLSEQMNQKHRFARDLAAVRIGSMNHASSKQSFNRALADIALQLPKPFVPA